MLKLIDYATAINFLLPKHYSGRKPAISYAFGWYEDEVLVGVVSYGKPASPSLCTGVCGVDYSANVYELNRLCTDGTMIAPISKLVGASLKALKQDGDKIIVSYADTAMGHNGYIYQATNFIYTGATKRRTDKYSGEGKHSRHYDKDAVEEYRQVRSSKHRYVIFNGSKTFNKHATRSLNYPVLPYPKGESITYELGTILKPEVYKV
jgi:hypothetical protein